MKSRNRSSTEKQIHKQVQINHNNYPNRELENNQKLANLLNLSQFYINDKKNINQNMATFFAGIGTKGKVNNSTQSHINNESSHQIKISKIQKNQHHDQPNSHNSRGSPNKASKNSKAKRSKSNKRNMLSCQQILNMAKKRDTWSTLALESNKNNTISQYGTTNNLITSNKSKRKHKKQNSSSTAINSINKSQTMINTNRIQISTNRLKQQKSNTRNWHSALGNYDDKNNIQQQSNNNLAVNYPLSMSHSYIVFSQKDSTMNNTTSIGNKLNKKSSTSSNQYKLIGLQQKLSQIKAQHAAVIIQKHWRGYLTRKLLQDYIKKEESHLIDRLTDLKTQKYNFDIPNKNNQLNLIHNNLWNCQNDNCSQISQIKQIQDCYSKQIYIKQKSDENKYSMQEGIQNKFLKYQKIDDGPLGSQQTQDRFPKNQNYSQGIQIKRTTKAYHKLAIFNVLSEKIIQDKNRHQNSQNKANIQQKLSQFTLYLKEQLNQKIQTYKKDLSQKVKQSLLQFNNMLQIREQLKSICNSLNQKINEFTESIRAIFSLVPSTQQNQFQFTPLIDNIVQSPRKSLSNKKQVIKLPAPLLKLQNCWDNSVELPSSKIISTQQQNAQNESSRKILSSNSNQKSQLVSNSSPISQYFTIDLPTQQLSPHKKYISSGLQNVKTYLYNLHQQYLTQSEKGSQTSFLCQVLKKHSEIGPENMIERCLIQMLVQMLTGQYMLQDILVAAEYLSNQIQNSDVIEDPNTIQFVRKWAEELDRWELRTIQQVSRNMEQSVDVSEKNNTSKRKTVIKQWLLED